jgi:hypothetical protein
MASKKRQTPIKATDDLTAKAVAVRDGVSAPIEAAGGPPERHAPGTAPTNPLTEAPAPNIRLRHRRDGSGRFHAARRRIPTRDGVEGSVVELPMLADGKPDQATQEAGWFCEYAHRILDRTTCPTGAILYAPITPKGTKR